MKWHEGQVVHSLCHPADDAVWLWSLDCHEDLLHDWMLL